MMGVLPSKTGLPSFPLASSSMQLRALLVVLGGFSLTTSEHHSERFNTGFTPLSIFSLLLVYSVFQSGPVAAWFSSKRFSARTWHPFFFLF